MRVAHGRFANGQSSFFEALDRRLSPGGPFPLVRFLMKEIRGKT